MVIAVAMDNNMCVTGHRRSRREANKKVIFLDWFHWTENMRNKRKYWPSNAGVAGLHWAIIKERKTPADQRREFKTPK